MSAEPTFPERGTAYKIGTAYWLKADAEAWAWRCADTMPDTAQGSRDSEADARTLSLYLDQYGWLNLEHSSAASWAMVADASWSMYHWADIREHVRAALKVCPGLR